MHAKTSQILTPEILFTPPGLRPTLPSQFKFSPCGEFVSYLKGTLETPTTLDLWHFERASSSHVLLLAAADLNAHADEAVTELSDAERAERERKRQFTFGISHYQWLGKDGSLAVYADGQAYLMQSTDSASRPLQITPSPHRHSGFNPSASGFLMSYVRDNNLFYKAMDNLENEIRVTTNGGENLSYGLADFLAAEEMHRFAGAWWSRCDRYLIYCRNDDTPVEVSHRMEIDGNGSRTVAQRYPYAGATNPAVTLHIFDTQTRLSEQIWASADGTNNTYLARILPVENGLCMQTQDRLQQNLSLRFYDFEQQNWFERYRETSATWINLTDDLHELDDHQLLFSSEDEGQRQAIVITPNNAVRRLRGPSHVNQILSTNEQTALVTGWDETPIDNHLFEIALDGSGYQQLTTQTGVHEVVVAQGTALLQSGLAGAVSASIPLFSLLAAVLFLPEERLTTNRVLGLLVGLIGVTLIAKPFSGGLGDSYLLGVLWMVFGSFSLGVSFVYARKFVTPLDLPPAALTTYQLGFATVILLAVTDKSGLGTLYDDPTSFAVLVFGLGFLGTGLAYVLYYYVISKLGAVRASALTYVPPVVALFLGALFLGEVIVVWDYVATVLIFAGVILVNKRPKSQS